MVAASFVEDKRVVIRVPDQIIIKLLRQLSKKSTSENDALSSGEGWEGAKELHGLTRGEKLISHKVKLGRDDEDVEMAAIC